MKFGIIGSNNYNNKTKIKEFLYILKDSIGDDLEVASGGNRIGAEYVIKKYCLQFEINYKEYNPAFTPFNLYSALPKMYYSKPKHGSHYLHRYFELCKGVDKLVIFVKSNEDISFFKPIISRMTKLKKTHVFIT